MTVWWQNINFRIKHQLYVRILPVVVIAVLAVGLFSGRLLTSRAVRTYVEQRAEEQGATLSEMLGRIGVLGLAAEARKDEALALLSADPGSPALSSNDHLMRSFLKLNGVRGAALIPVIPACPVESLHVTLDEVLDTPDNRQHLGQWAEKQISGFFNRSYDDLLSIRSWPGGPRLAPIDDSHTLWIFDPLELTAAEDSLAIDWNPDQTAATVPVLPILVRENLHWAQSQIGGPALDWRRPQAFLLLDISSLVAGTLLEEGGPRDVGMVLDRRGRLMCANIDTLTAGMSLLGEEQTVFRGVSGQELAVFLQDVGQPGDHSYLGSRWNPHIFMRADRPELPLLLVSALPFSEVHGGLVLYTAIVILMATIALLGSILAITQVGENLSGRLEAMSAHMGKVAAGEYGRRMEVGQEDEVGRLLGYFNLMTEGLDEAHRQLRENTQRLRVALAKMKRLDKAKDDFLSLISHEVRTPLTSIMGGIDFLHVILPQATEQQKQVCEELRLTEITQIIESSGHRLRDFMNDAILMTSLQSSDTKVDFAPVPASDLCELVLSGLQEEIARKRIEVANELSEAGSWQALCDRQLMVTALEKLLRNAAQHNHEGGEIRIREVDQIPDLGTADQVLGPEALLELQQRPAVARWQGGKIRWRIVSIYNTGPVIPQEKREALFKKFELVGRIEHHQKGSGLSLSIVQAVLENHGGKIFAESHDGDGNYFYIIIPAIEGAITSIGSDELPDQFGQSVGGAAGDEQVDLAADGAARDVELDHVGA